MIRQLVKNGNSKALNLDKTMRDHLGLKSDEIEVIMTEGQIVLKAPLKKMSFEEALESTLTEFDEAYRNLAK